MAWYKWSGGATLRKDLLEEAKRFAWEMNGKDNPTPLGQVVLSEDVPQSVRVRAVSGPTESPSTYFYSADRRADIQKSWPSILTLERQWRGHTYVFAVNAAEVYPGKSSYTDATVKAAFLNLPPTVSKAEVLFEKRILKVTKGAFEDDFNELGVHIY
jgi:hypothetical protein